MSAQQPDEDPGEVVDALPVVQGEEPRSPFVPQEPPAAPARVMPVAHAVAVAATGFAAGAVAAVVVGGVTKRHAVKAAERKKPKHGLPVVGSRSFLVDVHLLAPKER